MLRAIIFIFFCIQSSTVMIDSARILGIFPVPSISHQVVFRAVMLELAKRGHELVIITPNPALPKDRPPDNVTEIDIGHIYQRMSQMAQDAARLNMFKRGVIMDIDCVLAGGITKGVLDLIAYQLEMPEVKTFLEDKTQKFDLVFTEAIANYPLIVSHIFNAPAIVFSSFYGSPEYLETMGAVARHPIYYPNFYRQKYHNLTWWEKIVELYLEWQLYRMVKASENDENLMLKRQFGPDAPTVDDLKKNIQMLFLNSHHIFNNNRPVPPSVLHLGALHLQPVKQLPQELQTYLDNSTRGVIYVSLGTNVHTGMMEQSFLDAFLDAFKALPYDILWKFDSDDLENLSSNVKIQKWFPQRDLLMHPKIKVFVMQGGLQSTDEAIDAGVPLVGIPILGDQWFNVNKFLELGIGEHVDALTLTADDLVHAVNKVIADDRYRENIRRLRAVVNAQPQSSVERAVWWTEHVLQHGARHLHAPTHNVPWTHYYMVDVLAALAVVAVLTLALVTYVCCRVVSACTSKPGKTKLS